MFKLGECYEDDAKSIADYLRKAGIKIELKPSIDASIETGEFLQGRLSELKADIKEKDIVENYERYINALKKVLESKPSPDDFTEKYLMGLFPSLDEKRERLRAMAESIESEEDRSEAKEQASPDVNKQHDEQVSQTAGSEESAEQNNENRANELKEIASDLAKIFAEGDEAKAFAWSVLSLNGIEPGEDVGDRLDDPIVAIPVDLDDYGIEHPRAKSVISVYLDKCYELYIDELSALYSERLDDEFIKRYTNEHLKITSLDFLLTDLIKNHSSEKMDFQTFEDECLFVADSDNRTLRVIGHYVAEDIAKVLEKNGMIKIKGDTIRWKK